MDGAAALEGSQEWAGLFRLEKRQLRRDKTKVCNLSRFMGKVQGQSYSRVHQEKVVEEDLPVNHQSEHSGISCIKEKES